MKIFFFLFVSLVFFTACNNNGNTAKTFCDTTCKSDSFKYTANNGFRPYVSISVKNCEPDTVSWSHEYLGTTRQIQLRDFINQTIRLNSSAINCVIKDTSYAWLTFNDCITGRGFLLKLPYNKKESIIKLTGALNSFDPKFAVDPDLRAYTDRGSIFVVDVNSGKEAQMTFKETYDIDFNKLHEVVDSINVTRKRIYVKLLKKGQEVPLEKTIDL